MPTIDPILRIKLAAIAVAFGLAATPAAADLDVVFVLDTTGSMSRELGEVQQRVRQLAAALSSSRSGELLRFGVVAFRDRGDVYVTRHQDLTSDIDATEWFLASLRADGGGDGPEAVVAAVETALWSMAWNTAAGVERQVFLVGDAPPHLDYSDDPPVEDLIAEAQRARIVINTIGCRSLPPPGVAFFRRLAYATEGSYQHIGRVASAGTASVTDAMRRSVDSSAAEPGRELTVSWISHGETDTAGIQVRQGGPAGVAQSRDESGLDACTLEVLLPPGYELMTPPRSTLFSDRLRVELELGPGPGGRELFSLDACPDFSTPIDVVIGGAR